MIDYLKNISIWAGIGSVGGAFFGPTIVLGTAVSAHLLHRLQQSIASTLTSSSHFSLFAKKMSHIPPLGVNLKPALLTALVGGTYFGAIVGTLVGIGFQLNQD